MTTVDNLTVELLRQTVNFNPETGVFIWLKPRNTGRVKPGMKMGSMNHKGYMRCVLFGRSYLQHRLAWFYVHGEWPVDQLDHINGIKHDNRLSNLRPANSAENQQNRAIAKNNAHGFAGATFNKRKGRWQAHIGHQKVRKHLGYYDTPQAAHAAYLAAKSVLHTFSPHVRGAA